MTAPAMMRGPDAQAAPDLRHVTVSVDDIGTLSLMELAEVSELSGVPLERLVVDVTSGDMARMIRVVVAIAVVIERRDDPRVGMDDARRWTIDLVGERADPPVAGRARRRGPGSTG